ncbi:MAG: coproporphyrinogen dehydrogenase HemZ [Clostridia bacterium]|nr:coproporphyrinogen dehydrogenase HemZ [Clostridia bacterium]
MQLCNIGHGFDYETEKVIRIFFPFIKINTVRRRESGDNTAICELLKENGNTAACVSLNISGKTANAREAVPEGDSEAQELAMARCLYKCLSDITGYKSDWGILTGIRPAKLFSALSESGGEKFARERFKADYLANDNKISLCAATAKSEEKIIALSRDESFSLYVSVPFCPSRCSYCSFVSHSVENAKDIIPEYLKLLEEELKVTGKIAKQLNLRLETVYVGGGTPTSVTAEQLKRLLFCIRENFDFSFVREFTVEAGRPDTVDTAKLNAIKAAGATRISINPQTMNDNVLKAIGRRHTAAQQKEAFYLARAAGFDNINTDLIAGLSSDTTESFRESLNKILELDPESITVHALSVKRAANISRAGDLPDMSVGLDAAKMVDYARQTLVNSGLLPYYMYRQSKTVGNLENVGYAKPGFEGLYNVYIMDETHTVLACGASAVSKLKEPRGNNIERIFNFKYPYEYINRFSEIIARKEGVKRYYDKYPVFNK